MYQIEDQLTEMIELWEQVEDIIRELRIGTEVAINRCNDLTDERDEKGYRLLEAEETIQELKEEIQRLKEVKQKKNFYRHGQRRLKLASHTLLSNVSIGRIV